MGDDDPACLIFRQGLPSRAKIFAGVQSLFMKHSAYQLFLLLCICIAVLPGCEDKGPAPGEYFRRFDGEHAQRIDLQLDPSGQGSWTIDDNRIPFKWESQSEQILLHTEAGAIIQGRLSQGQIEFTIPGAGTATFEKVTTRQE